MFHTEVTNEKLCDERTCLCRGWVMELCESLCSFPRVFQRSLLIHQNYPILSAHAPRCPGMPCFNRLIHSRREALKQDLSSGCSHVATQDYPLCTHAHTLCVHSDANALLCHCLPAARTSSCFMPWLVECSVVHAHNYQLCIFIVTSMCLFPCMSPNLRINRSDVGFSDVNYKLISFVCQGACQGARLLVLSTTASE